MMGRPCGKPGQTPRRGWPAAVRFGAGQAFLTLLFLGGACLVQGRTTGAEGEGLAMSLAEIEGRIREAEGGDPASSRLTALRALREGIRSRDAGVALERVRRLGASRRLFEEAVHGDPSDPVIRSYRALVELGVPATLRDDRALEGDLAVIGASLAMPAPGRGLSREERDLLCDVLRRSDRKGAGHGR